MTALIWLSHFIPFPPRGGAPQRSYHLLREASRRRDTMLIAFNRPAERPEALKGYAAALRAFCAEVEFWDLPFPWKGPRWWAGLLANSAQSLPHACEVYRSPKLLMRWRALMAENPETLVHVDSSDLAAFVPAARQHHVLLNHHNCESVMAERRARLEPHPLKRLLLNQQSRRQAELERTLCAEVNVNAVVSREDAESLRRQAPGAHVHVVANGTDTDYFNVASNTDYSDVVVFAGSLSWYPNVSGLSFFRESVWPLLKRERPEIKCLLAGKSPAREVAAWAAVDPSVTLVADPDDIRPWIARGTVFVCPIVDGGGTRLKLLDAMSSGKAIVSTRVGAEGLGVTANREMLLADSAGEFANLTLLLLREPELRRSLAQNARAFVERNFSWHTIAGQLESAYTCAGRHESIE